MEPVGNRVRLPFGASRLSGVLAVAPPLSPLKKLMCWVIFCLVKKKKKQFRIKLFKMHLREFRLSAIHRPGSVTSSSVKEKKKIGYIFSLNNPAIKFIHLYKNIECRSKLENIQREAFITVGQRHTNKKPLHAEEEYLAAVLLQERRRCDAHKSEVPHSSAVIKPAARVR